MMEYRRFGNTDLKVGMVGVGCMTFGWRADAAETNAIVAAALGIGINLFDTAVSYGRGVSETMLGQALKRTGRRNDVLIATKFGGAATADAKPEELGNSRRTLLAQCELSLRRLQTDWIDLLQIHHFSANVPFEETLGGLEQLVREGKVRHIGCSNFDGAQLLAVIECANRRQLCEIASHQSRFNLLDRRAETDVIPIAYEHGVANLTYSPLAEGLLTGKYRAGEAFPTDSRFAVASPANNYQARLDAPMAIRANLGALQSRDLLRVARTVQSRSDRSAYRHYKLSDQQRACELDQSSRGMRAGSTLVRIRLSSLCPIRGERCDAGTYRLKPDEVSDADLQAK
jgi:aryl-alcohol dehydrogenase-like predicted oxidoreductase